MTDRPNIVMVSWDSVRADHMPFHGYGRNTCPFVNAKIEADEALVFENAQVSAVGTPASFSGVFTGRHASGTMESPNPNHWRSSLEGKRLLPEALQDAGYYTGGFHFNALMSSGFGWNRGWDVYEDHLWDGQSEAGPSDGDDGDADGGVKQRLYDFLQRRDMANFVMHAKKMAAGEMPEAWESMWDDIAAFVEDAPEPWFLWVLLIDTHHPYYAPESAHRWPQPGIRSTYAFNYLMRRHRNVVGERRQSIINAYDNTMLYADDFVERLSETLAAEGYADAPFIFHSDHGDEMGEHANYGHRPLMYDTVTRVPLVMWNVGRTGTRDGPHSLLDLGNAVLELADSDERLGEGRSLLSETDARDAVTIQNLLTDELGRTAAAVGPEWKVLYHPEGEWGHGLDFQTDSWEAYRHGDDPMEQTNRWGDHPAELEDRLREQLETDPGTTDDDDEDLDSQTEERLRELGYIE